MNEDKASRYHRLKRQASIASLVCTLALLAGLISTGASLSLRSAAERAAFVLGGSQAWQATATVVMYVALLSALAEAGSFPFAVYSDFLLERRYGLSNERLGGWLLDQAKSFGLGLLLGCGGAAILYALIRYSPERWWLPAGGGLRARHHRIGERRAGAAAAAVLSREAARPRVAARRACSAWPNAPAPACSAPTNGA